MQKPVDRESKLTLLVEPESWAGQLGLPVERLHVEWESGGVELSPEAANYLDARWSRYLADAQAQHKTLFNAGVSRLIEARHDVLLRDGREERIVTLRLGPTDYKTFLVTRIRDREWFELHAPQVQALALGNSALLTSGDLALLGIRSSRVSAYGGRAHLMGGVLDLLGNGRFTATAEGIVAHLLVELHEEAAVKEADLEARGIWPRFLGIAQDAALGQPEAIWQWETRSALEDIGHRLDAAEHGGWIIASRGHLQDGLWDLMTPVARYAWRIWSDAQS